MTCIVCNLDKPKTEYYKNAANKDGISRVCKFCEGERNRRYREKLKARKKDVPLLKKKICTGCNEVKSVSAFYKSKNRKDGYTSKCKECRRLSYKHALKRDPDLNKKTWKKYYAKEENKQKVKEAGKEYYVDHKDYHSEKNKKWHEENKEYHLKLVRDWYNNTEKGKQQTKAKSQNRRDREKKAGKLTAAIIRIVEAENIEQFGKLTCVYCKKTIKREYHLDHIVPLVKGGKNRKLNLCVACSSCNIKKGTMPATEFRRSMLKSI